MEKSFLQEELEKRRQRLLSSQAENDLLGRQIESCEQSICKLAGDLTVSREALAFLEELSNARRGQIKGYIEDVVTEAVRLLYGEDFRVELTYGVKNNRSSLQIEMVRETKDGEVRREFDGFGGGMSDTISVPLRLLVLVRSKNQTDRIALLDECYKHINTEKVPLVAEFLKVLKDRLKIQVIICSHHVLMREWADKTYHVQDVGGKSKITVKEKL